MTDSLHARMAEVLAPRQPREVKMFGGVCFMVNGNMLAGVSPRGMLVRVGPEAHADAVRRPGASAMEMGGRMMAGYVFVAPEAIAGDEELGAWLDAALAFNRTLPANASRSRKRKPRAI